MTEEQRKVIAHRVLTHDRIIKGLMHQGLTRIEAGSILTAVHMKLVPGLKIDYEEKQNGD